MSAPDLEYGAGPYYGATEREALRAAGIETPRRYYRKNAPCWDLVAWRRGTIGRTTIYRVPVLVRENNAGALCTERVAIYFVQAPTATAAANWIRDHEYSTRPETEIYAFGPRGGVVHRYVGWESAIGNAIMNGSASS